MVSGAGFDLVERPKSLSKGYCGVIREGTINQLTERNNGLPLDIGEEEALFMWENEVHEVHVTQHELLSVNLGQFWYKDTRISTEFQYKGRVIRYDCEGIIYNMIAFQEVHHDYIFVTLVGDEKVCKWIQDNKKFISERPEDIKSKIDKKEDYKTLCWWSQKDFTWQQEYVDKNNVRITTMDDYDFEDEIIYSTWDSVKKNVNRPKLRMALARKEEQLERYQSKLDDKIISLVDLFIGADFTKEIRRYDGETLYNKLEKAPGFQVEFGGELIGKDMAWTIWKRFRIPELICEIEELKEKLREF